MAKLMTIKITVADALSNGMGDLEELRDEVREVYENMPESLQGGERGIKLDEAANILDAIDSCDLSDEVTNTHMMGDDEEERPAAGGIEFETLDLRSTKKRRSRAARRDDALELLRGARDALQEALDNDDTVLTDVLDDEIRQDIDSITQLIDEAETAEFPGMFG